jgi:hypothetical protein
MDPVERKIITRAQLDDDLRDDILDKNMAAANESIDGKYNDPSGWTKVASIPLWLIEKWKIEEGIDFNRWNEDDKARIMRKLNDPEYLKLRTRKGKL